MSLIKFFYESLKYSCLYFLSMAQSFNYLNYIPFIIIFLRESKNIDLNNNIFLLIYFVSYEIVKYFSSCLTNQINYLIGEHFYYSLSICVLSIINLIFSFVSFSYNNIFIFILHRIFISLFNNIASNIDLPLSLFYSKKQIIFKKRNFSFIQKLTNFFFFFFYLLFFNHFKQFYLFCFILSVLNLICFILSLIIMTCHKENLYNKYIQSLSDKEIENSIIKTSQKGKTDNNKNNEIMVDIYNNNNSVSNNNVSTGVNNMENLIKENKNKMKSNLINNEYIKNDTKSMEISNKNKSKINSSIFKGIVAPFSYKENQNQKFNHSNIKILVSLLIVLILSKSQIFFVLYMLLFKVNEVKILSSVDENNNELLFSNISSFLHLNSIEEEYIFLFVCYYFLNIFQYFINLSYTSISFKKKYINYLFYYLSLIIMFISNLIFLYYYSQKYINIKISTKKIRKGVVICFAINFIINECIMIMSVFYNILGKKKGFSERLLKDIKTLSIFLASLIFSIIQILTIFIDTKLNNDIENYIYFIIFCLFFIIIFLISILFLNY